MLDGMPCFIEFSINQVDHAAEKVRVRTGTRVGQPRQRGLDGVRAGEYLARAIEIPQVQLDGHEHE